jgi:hypothetical protein
VLSLDPQVPKDTSYLPEGGESTFEVRTEDLEASLIGVDQKEQHQGDVTFDVPSFNSGPDISTSTTRLLRHEGGKQASPVSSPRVEAGSFRDILANKLHSEKPSGQDGQAQGQGNNGTPTESPVTSATTTPKVTKHFISKTKPRKAASVNLNKEEKPEKHKKSVWGNGEERKMGGWGGGMMWGDKKGISKQGVQVPVTESCVRDVKENLALMHHMDTKELQGLLSRLPPEVVGALRSIQEYRYVCSLL